MTSKKRGKAKPDEGPPPKEQHGKPISKFRNYMLAGMLVVAPFAITFYLAWLFIDFVDTKVKPLIPLKYNPDTYLPFGVPGIGLVIVILFLAFVGWVTAGFLGPDQQHGDTRTLTGARPHLGILGKTCENADGFLGFAAGQSQFRHGQLGPDVSGIDEKHALQQLFGFAQASFGDRPLGHLNRHGRHRVGLRRFHHFGRCLGLDRTTSQNEGDDREDGSGPRHASQPARRTAGVIHSRH